MSREKYLANIDRVLQDVLRRNSKDLGDQNKIAYSEELEDSGAILKIAFDVYRVENDPYNGLWTVEEHDGKQYLVRASDPKSEREVQGDWAAVSSHDKDNITLVYKKVPIARFSSDKYGFDSRDIITFKMALLDSINDAEFIRDILLEQPESKRAALVSEFPEFHKLIKG